VTVSNCARLAHDMYQNGRLSTPQLARVPYKARHFWAVILLFTILAWQPGVSGRQILKTLSESFQSPRDTFS